MRALLEVDTVQTTHIPRTALAIGRYRARERRPIVDDPPRFASRPNGAVMRIAALNEPLTRNHMWWSRPRLELLGLAR